MEDLKPIANNLAMRSSGDTIFEMLTWVLMDVVSADLVIILILQLAPGVP
jgi:hypothetical protein